MKRYSGICIDGPNVGKWIVLDAPVCRVAVFPKGMTQAIVQEVSWEPIPDVIYRHDPGIKFPGGALGMWISEAYKGDAGDYIGQRVAAAFEALNHENV